MDDPARVLLVDDHELVRRGLASLLATEEDVLVVGEAASAIEALALLPSCRPHVALVDVRMPGMDGIALVSRLHETAPQVAALMLTTFDDDEYIFGALQAGARGYLLKDTSPDELVRAVLRARRGETVLTGPITARVVAELSRSGPRARTGPSSTTALTPREHDLAQLVADGLSNAQIARRLFLAEGTIRNQTSKLLTKLGLQDRTQLAIWVHQRRGGN